MSVSVLTSSATSYLRLTTRVEAADWEGLYDRLEIWRSVLGEGGPYEELSAASALPASISSAIGALTNIVGKVLNLQVDEETNITVTFSGTDPLSAAAIASQIDTAGSTYLNASITDDRLLLETTATGGLHSLRVVGGDAAALLGLPLEEPDSLKYGQDVRPTLVHDTFLYSFTDYWSESTYFYKTRFLKVSSGLRSPFTDPVAATQKLGVDPALVVIGYVQLLYPDGRPASSQEVTLFNSYDSTRIAGGTIVGGPKQLITNSDGYVEFTLLRGLKFDIGIGGTSYIRRVTAPTLATVLKFDVFDPLYGEDDNFSVQRSELPYAVRTA